MRKIAIIVLFLYAAWRLIKIWGKGVTQRSRGAEDFSRFSPKSRRRRQSGVAPTKELGMCSVCGTHVPVESLVRAADGSLCCSEECLRLQRGRKSGESDGDGA